MFTLPRFGDPEAQKPKYKSLDLLLVAGQQVILRSSSQRKKADAVFWGKLNNLSTYEWEWSFMEDAFENYVEAFNKCLIWGVFNADEILASVDYYQRNIVGDPETAYLLVRNPDDGANKLIDVFVADYEESEGPLESPPDRLLSDPWLAEALQR